MKKILLILSIVFLCSFVAVPSANTYSGRLVGFGIYNNLPCIYYLSDYDGIALGSDGTLYNTSSEKIGALSVSNVELSFRLLPLSSSVIIAEGDSNVLYNIVVDVVPTSHSASDFILVFAATFLVISLIFLVLSGGVLL